MITGRSTERFSAALTARYFGSALTCHFRQWRYSPKGFKTAKAPNRCLAINQRMNTHRNAWTRKLAHRHSGNSFAVVPSHFNFILFFFHFYLCTINRGVKRCVILTEGSVMSSAYAAVGWRAVEWVHDWYLTLNYMVSQTHTHTHTHAHTHTPHTHTHTQQKHNEVTDSF